MATLDKWLIRASLVSRGPCAGRPTIDVNRRLIEKSPIEQFARRNAGTYLFELADLDDAAWQQSEYYGLDSSAALAELCLFYRGLQLPNLVATVAHHKILMRELLRDVAEHLPPRFSAALSAGIAPALADRFRIEEEVPFLRMAVTDLHRIRWVDVSGVEPLTEEVRPGSPTSWSRASPTCVSSPLP